MKQVETDSTNQTKTLSNRFAGGSSNRTAKSQSGRSEESIYRCIGIERNTRKVVGRFKLMLRTGRVTSVPYALLPIITYNPDRELAIRTSGFEVRITGRGLDKIEAFLSEEKLLWMRESGSEMDDKSDAILDRKSVV